MLGLTQLAAECLDLDEKPVLSAMTSFSTESPVTYTDPYTGEAEEDVETTKGKGALFLTTKNRLVFVTARSSLLGGKRYEVAHSIHIRDIRNVRSEGHDTLRVEYQPLNSDHRTVARYRLSPVQEWVSRIKQMYYAL